jgi:hypothetical protein
MYSSTLSLTSALDGVRGQRLVPAALPPAKWAGVHCTGGRVGPRAGMDGCWKSRPHLDTNPGPSKPVASSYTDYAVQAHQTEGYTKISFHSTSVCVCVGGGVHKPLRKYTQWHKSNVKPDV